MTARMAIYARISKDNAGTGLGVARQEADCRALAKARGWTVAVVHTDNDISAYSGRRRPGYEQLLDDLRTRTVDGVIAWHPDRLHRAPIELEEFIAVVNDVDALVDTVQSGRYDLATATGRQIARILGAVARAESEHKSDRLKRKHLELAQAGKVSGGGIRPYGYARNRIDVIEDEALIVVEVAARALTGESLTSIARALDERGVRTVTGARWCRASLASTLRAPRIAGLRALHGEIMGPAVWPAILDRETWEATRAAIAPRTRRPGGNARRYLLVGVATCGVCGTKLVSRPHDGRRSLACSSRPEHGGCGGVGRNAAHVETYVGRSLIGRLENGGLDRAIAAAKRDRASAGAGTSDQLAGIDRRLVELAEMWAAGEIDRREWMTARAGIEERRAGIVETLADSRRTSALTVLAGPGDMWERWEQVLTFEQRRAAILETVDRVVVSPTRKRGPGFDDDAVEIVWRS